MLKRLIYSLFLIPYSLFSQTQDIPLPANWVFHKLHEPVWQPAVVPGTVHTDLLRNGKIASPFFSSNEKDLQYIEHEIYEYEGTFTLTEKQLTAKEIALIFEGLDTYSQVKLNGVEILQSNNMFRTYEVAAKNRLKEGENTLIVRFYPAADSGKILLKNNPHVLPEKERIYTRKAQYQYGWDWGPRYVICGIWRPIRLRLNWGSKLEEVHFIQKSLSPTLAEMTAQLTVFSDAPTNRKIEISDLNHRILIEKEVALVTGMNIIKIPFSVKNPLLWFPNGYGEAHLYSFNVKILDEKLVEDIKNLTWGFRTIEVIQEKDSIGRSFYLKVNGIPIFIKGANWIPANSFPTNVSYDINGQNPANIPHLIEASKDAHFNMLRVWGGGYYEDDRFYQLCDANGILVWQDFMFACGMYPGDKAFLDNIQQEFIDNIKRLRNHPCIALWCGNNENDEGWHNWGWQKSLSYSQQDSTEVWQDYLHVFHQMLPTLLSQYDPTRYYHPSSPANGWGREKAYKEGDVHYWGVWWGLEDYHTYQQKVGRFHSEYGMQALPDYTTIQAFTDKKDRKLLSQALKDHQKHPTGFKNLDTYLERDFPKTKDLFHYTYLTQLLQAEAMQTAIYAHRSAKPYCMGTLYWQLNDCWPSISWSSIDYYGNWKASHYAIKKAFAPIVAVITEKQDSLLVNIVSDKVEKTELHYSIILQEVNGKFILAQAGINTEFINNMQSALLLPKNFDRKRCFVHVSIDYDDDNNKSQTSEYFHYFVPTKDLVLDPKPKIKMHGSPSSSQLLHISSNTLVKNVFLYLENKPLHLSDNYFDLPANQVKTIELPEGVNSKDIKILYLNELSEK